MDFLLRGATVNICKHLCNIFFHNNEILRGWYENSVLTPVENFLDHNPTEAPKSVSICVFDASRTALEGSGTS